jgi:hypothetical protein
VEFVEGFRILPRKREVLLQEVQYILTDSGKITEVVLGTVDGDPGVRHDGVQVDVNCE